MPHLEDEASAIDLQKKQSKRPEKMNGVGAWS
jgi:hypothetical protein